MSDLDFRLTVRNDAQWPVFLSLGGSERSYSNNIAMADDGPQLGDTRYLAAGGTLVLAFRRGDDRQEGRLALRAAYDPFGAEEDGAWQQFRCDGDGLAAHGPAPTYASTFKAGPPEGDLRACEWAIADAADWPEGWSRTPLENPIALAYTSQYDKVWDDSGSGAIFSGSIYKPRLDGYFNLGFTSFGPASYDPPGGVGTRAALVAKPLQPGVVVPPDSYEWIGDDHNGGAHLDCSWWRPVPPKGFVALGTAFVGYHGMPPPDAIACVREDLAGPATGGKMVYADRGAHATHDVEIFEVYAAAPGCVQVGASVVSSSYILGSPPELSGVAVAALKPPARADRSDALTPADVEKIISESGPLLLLHPQEEWMPLAADRFVEAATRSGDYLTVSDPAILKGDLSTAKAYVFANYVCSQFTDLQFWIFYAYNGAPFIQIQLWLASGGVYLWSTSQDEDNLDCGQHQGDWETVTLRVDNQQKKVVAVGYTSHGDTEWYAAPEGQVKAYSALHVHGCYPVPGEFLELAAWQEKEFTLAHLEVKIFSRNICADGGPTLDTSTGYQIVESNFLPGISAPDWLGPDFASVKWGPRVAHEDRITITGVPFIGSYDYDHQQEDWGRRHAFLQRRLAKVGALVGRRLRGNPRHGHSGRFPTHRARLSRRRGGQPYGPCRFPGRREDLRDARSARPGLGHGGADARAAGGFHDFGAGSVQAGGGGVGARRKHFGSARGGAGGAARGGAGGSVAEAGGEKGWEINAGRNLPAPPPHPYILQKGPQEAPTKPALILSAWALSASGRVARTASVSAARTFRWPRLRTIAKLAASSARRSTMRRRRGASSVESAAI